MDKELEQIVQRMIAAGESHTSIQSVIDAYNSKKKVQSPLDVNKPAETSLPEPVKSTPVLETGAKASVSETPSTPIQNNNPFVSGGQYNNPPKTDISSLDLSNTNHDAAIAAQIQTPLKKIPLTPILDNTTVEKPVPQTNEEEDAKKRLSSKLNMQLAIDNTTKKVLENKGIVAGKGSPLYEEERKKIEEKTKPTIIGGINIYPAEATFHHDFKTGQIGLDRNLGFLEGIRKGFNDAVDGEDEANAFSAMSTEQKVQYANKQIQDKSPEYMAERNGVGGLLGGSVPYLVKAAAATTLATAAGIAAPETGGASLAGAAPVLTVLLTAPDMIKQGAKDEIMARYSQLKQENPNGDEVKLMKIAEQGELSGGIIGAANALAFTTTLKLPIFKEGKSVLNSYINNVASSAVHLGGITAGAKAVQLGARKIDGYNVETDQAIKDITDTFTENATSGAILTGLISGAHTLPKLVKSAYKFALKDTPISDIATGLQANEDIGRIPPGTTQDVVSDIKDYNTALQKTDPSLSPETKASVAGLIQVKDNLTKQLAGLDETQTSSVQKKIEAVNKQIKDITESGKPFDFEVDDATGNIIGNPENISQPIELNVNQNEQNKIQQTATAGSEATQSQNTQSKGAADKNTQSAATQNIDLPALATEIKKANVEGIGNLTDAKNEDVVNYAIDKAAESPSKFSAQHPEIFDKIKDQIPTEKLQENLDFLIKNNPDSKDVDVLDKMIVEREAKAKPTVEKAIIEINGKTYEGDNHAQAILKAKDGLQKREITQEQFDNIDRQRDGKFKLSDGSIIDRATAKERFGADKSELLIPQNAEADKANADYKKEQGSDDVANPVSEVGKGKNENGSTWEEVVTEKDGLKITRYKTTRINKEGQEVEANDGTRASKTSGREMTYEDFSNQFDLGQNELDRFDDIGKKPIGVIIHEIREGDNGNNAMTVTWRFEKNAGDRFADNREGEPSFKFKKEQPQPQKEGAVSNPALKDVESTAKALDADKIKKIEDATGLDASQENLNDGTTPAQYVASMYHLSKKDGTNPELVKAVEQLLSQPTDNTLNKEPTVSKVVEDKPTPENKNKTPIVEGEKVIPERIKNKFSKFKETNNEPLKIVQDDTENEHANSKLTEQDNPIQEPNVKAIEGEAENADSPQKAAEVLAKVNSTINKALDVEVKPIADISTDELKVQQDKLGTHLSKENDLISGDKAQQSLFQVGETQSQKLSAMKEIVKDLQDEGFNTLDEIQKIAAKELGDNTPELKQLVEDAYHAAGNENKLVSESPELRTGLAKRINSFVSKIFGKKADHVSVLKDNDAMFKKVSELQGDGKKVNFSINGENVTGTTVGGDVVNGFYSPIEKRINEFKQDRASDTNEKIEKQTKQVEDDYISDVQSEVEKIGDLTLEKIPIEKIVNSDNPRVNRERHTEIMKKISKLNQLIKCK